MQSVSEIGKCYWDVGSGGRFEKEDWKVESGRLVVSKIWNFDPKSESGRQIGK